MTENEVIRVEENGVEFFTIVATGESAVSVRGLARMCGVTQRAIQKIFTSSDDQNATKMLGSLVLQDFYVTTKITTKGGEIKAIKATVAAKIIRYYDRKGNAIAQASADAIMAIGLTSYIQSKTGWLPEKYTAAPEKHRILDEYARWEKLYEPEMCKKAFSWFGAKFYWDYCYHWMTPEERCKVNRLNPVINGKRARKIHQYLDEDIRRRLAPKIETLGMMLIISKSKQQFLSNYKDTYGRGMQLDLLT